MSEEVRDPKIPRMIQARSERQVERIIVGVIAVAWGLFQLALPRFLILDSVTVRALHLAFALALVFLTVPMFKNRQGIPLIHHIGRVPLLDGILVIVGVVAVLNIVLDWEGISQRAGRPIARDIVFGVLLIVIVLEACRRVIGPALSIIAVVFTIYAFFAPYMPAVLAMKAVSVNKYMNQVALSTEGIYGIPLDVSANTVFLFVLLGSMLDRFGAGAFFNDFAISLLGRFKGGPAKASVVSSGLTGLVSGSSIANVVTTGTFTIPLMKKVGYPAKIAAATEVAASTNGQLMPPIMGAAAFIIAEYLGVGYLDVVKAAAIPAVVSYFALFYITHLEASKRNMSGLPKEEIPAIGQVLKKGFHYLIPIGVLVYQLIVLRRTPKLAAFNAIIALVLTALVVEILRGLRDNKPIPAVLKDFGMRLIDGLISGAKNMLSVALATATAGIVVGIVTMGLGGMIVQIVEYLSAGNIFLLLFITAIASLVLGMGLPTTATYIVMASITVPVIVNLSPISAVTGVALIPAIAAHLFCFYFGILADDTPPVGLAAYAASAIAESDPIATGVQGFLYDLRTAVIPFMFVFNAELVLYGIYNFWQAMLIFTMATFAALAFTNAVQGWFIVKNRWYEVPLFLAATLILFHPGSITGLLGVDHENRYYMYFVGLAIYGAAYLLQRLRIPSKPQQRPA